MKKYQSVSKLTTRITGVLLVITTISQAAVTVYWEQQDAKTVTISWEGSIDLADAEWFGDGDIGLREDVRNGGLRHYDGNIEAYRNGVFFNTSIPTLSGLDISAPHMGGFFGDVFEVPGNNDNLEPSISLFTWSRNTDIMTVTRLNGNDLSLADFNAENFSNQIAWATSATETENAVFYQTVPEPTSSLLLSLSLSSFVLRRKRAPHASPSN